MHVSLQNTMGYCPGDTIVFHLHAIMIYWQFPTAAI